MISASADGDRGTHAVAWIAGTLAAGSAALAIGHAGVRVPFASALGPGGSRVIVPAAIGFTVGALLHGVVAYGVVRRRSWAWPVGIVVATVTLLAAAVPFRGAGSVAGIALAASELGLLLRGGVRRALGVGDDRSGATA